MREPRAMSGCGRRRRRPGQPPEVPKRELKWTEADFAEAKAGRLPMGKATDEWTYGDLDAGFKNAALVLDETFVTPNTSHQTLETRSAMAYWQNGKVYIHTGTQSTAQTLPAIARWLDIDPDNVVFISEYTGGGFGSKITGGISLIIPALLVEKNQCSGDDAHQPRGGDNASDARVPAFQGRMKVGFSKEGRITGPRHVRDLRQRSLRSSGRCPIVGPHRLVAVPAASHALAGVTVLTNTPPRSAQSAPGGMQGIAIMEPILAKAARKLGIDQVAIRRINCPEGKAPVRTGNARGSGSMPRAHSSRKRSTAARSSSSGSERKARSAKRNGTKVRGVGVSLSCYVGGTIGFDGLLVIKPDGRIYIPVRNRQPRNGVGDRRPPRGR